MYHRVPEIGEAGGSARPCDICGIAVPREVAIVEAQPIPVPIPDEPVVARGALKPGFTTAQNVAMRNLAQRLVWSLAVVRGLPDHQTDIDNVCKEIDVTRKQFRDWVSKYKPWGVSHG